MLTLLAPVLALVAWTFVVFVWMFATRIPAMAKLRIAPETGTHVQNLHNALPPYVRAVGDNYNHLHEQPTLFYAVAITLYLLDAGGVLALALAWAYVASRVVHSFVQIIVRQVPVRFLVFMISSGILAALAALAGIALLAT